MKFVPGTGPLGNSRSEKTQGLSHVLTLQGALVYAVVSLQGDKQLYFLGLVFLHLSDALCH